MVQQKFVNLTKLKLKLMKRIAITSVLILGAICTMAQKNVSSYPATGEGAKPGAYIYSLPQTSLVIKVKVAHLVFKSGPYAQYAQKYLGITDAEATSKEYYSILGIKSSTIEEADPNSLYVAEIPYGSDLGFFDMAKQGLIVPSAFVAPGAGIAPPSKEVVVANPFTDTGIEPSIYKENATFFSGVKMDTSFVKVPVQKNMLVEKSPESKASDAANFIFNLRKRRVDLITGDVDNVFNNGEALKVALSEISRLEKEYLSLFIGKTFVDTLSYQLMETPKSDGGSKSSSILCRFSESKGIVGENDLSGRPLMIEVIPNNITQQLQMTNSEKGRDAIFARYPEVCTIKIIDGKEVIFTGREPISQLGKIIKMPINFPSTGKR